MNLKEDQAGETALTTPLIIYFHCINLIIGISSRNNVKKWVLRYIYPLYYKGVILNHDVELKIYLSLIMNSCLDHS